MNLWIKVAVLVIVQVGALIAIIADKQWTLRTGIPVVLQTAPVDPRSLFMGDYARLVYAINRLRLDGVDAVGGDKDFKRHDAAWVALKVEPSGVQALSVHHERSSVPSGLLALKGEVQAVFDQDWDAVLNQPVQGRSLQLRYGIEQYYVQEGKGREIERPEGGEKVSIRVAIDSRGRAGILGVLLNGQERYQETLF